ncbi:UNVERIFIED_CONTAM: hypothetical protein FKN15_012411 [Acipenser sinensis]
MLFMHADRQTNRACRADSVISTRDKQGLLMNYSSLNRAAVWNELRQSLCERTSRSVALVSKNYQQGPPLEPRALQQAVLLSRWLYFQGLHHRASSSFSCYPSGTLKRFHLDSASAR